jgi:hypothetical protein
LFLEAEQEIARGEFIDVDEAKGCGARARDQEGREQEIPEETYAGA